VKFEDGGLTRSVSGNRQDVAHRIIAIPDCITAGGHGANQPPQFVVAVADWPAEDLLRNRERDSIALQAAVAHNHIACRRTARHHCLNSAIGPTIDCSGLPAESHRTRTPAKIAPANSNYRSSRTTGRIEAAECGR